MNEVNVRGLIQEPLFVYTHIRYEQDHRLQMLMLNILYNIYIYIYILYLLNIKAPQF
jgi:hypothetical protein